MRKTLPLAALLLFTACGAPSAKYKFDDVALAQVPLQEKQVIFAAEQDVHVARAKKQAAQADVEKLKNDWEVAKVERQKASLAVETSKLEADLAEKAHDVNRQTAAAEKRRVAEMGMRAAGAKVDMADAKLDWQEEIVALADKDIVTALTKVELEKARLGDAKGIKPTRDFKLELFVTEYAARQKAADEQRREVDEAKQKLDARAQQWRDLETQYQQASAPSAPPAPPAVPSAPPAPPAAVAPAMMPVAPVAPALPAAPATPAAPAAPTK